MSRFPLATSLLADAIRQRIFPGAAFGVLERGHRLAVESIGQFTYDANAPAVHPQTVFDMASVTKVMATTAMAMLLWQRGQLDLDEAVGVRLPEFLVPGFEPSHLDTLRSHVTTRMLLAHSSGLPGYAPLYKNCSTRTELLDACLHMPLEAEPGIRSVYSDIGFILLGHLMETLAGERLEGYCGREIFAPLEMESTRYCPPAAWRPTIPPTAAADSFRGRVIQGEVHDDNCWVLGGVSGHAGIFSNVSDTLNLAACLLRGGGTVFSSETIATFTTRQKFPPADEWALGWDTSTPPSSSGQFFSARSVGHLGYTGTSLWIDFEKDLAVVLLTNRTYPSLAAEGASNRVRSFRPRFHDALMQELGWHGATTLPPVNDEE